MKNVLYLFVILLCFGNSLSAQDYVVDTVIVSNHYNYIKDGVATVESEDLGPEFYFEIRNSISTKWPQKPVVHVKTGDISREISKVDIYIDDDVLSFSDWLFYSNGKCELLNDIELYKESYNLEKVLMNLIPEICVVVNGTPINICLKKVGFDMK